VVDMGSPAMFSGGGTESAGLGASSGEASWEVAARTGSTWIVSGGEGTAGSAGLGTSLGETSWGSSRNGFQWDSFGCRGFRWESLMVVQEQLQVWRQWTVFARLK
jgi:hypothetical protein